MGREGRGCPVRSKHRCLPLSSRWQSWQPGRMLRVAGPFCCSWKESTISHQGRACGGRGGEEPGGTTVPAAAGAIPMERDTAPSHHLSSPLPADGLSPGQWDRTALLLPINTLTLQLGQVQPGVRERHLQLATSISPVLQLHTSPARLLPSAWGWRRADMGTERMERAKKLSWYLCPMCPETPIQRLLSAWL